ncbi:MAG TPA: NAD-dependent epimerase/dehydratase family protein [Rhodothermales bacterium]|nr:NAD-dependent epimerase/dehydratase family protein [Rhodothermales bacterium]
MKTAVVMGGTGLVGRHLVDLLLADDRYSRVILLMRRPSGLIHPKINEQVVDFEQLDFQTPVDDVFCCIGTTIKVAGSQAAQYRVEVDYPVQLARQALAYGARQFLIVTSTGADPKSRVFYNRMKGDVEQKLANIGYATLHILRPSLLLGNRLEHRAGETLAIHLARWTSWMMVGPLRRYRAVEAITVAQALKNLAQNKQIGIFFHESEVLEAFDKYYHNH